ncbi:hypothetical protein RND71_024886 [Anisodus tanguticus]|uniref:O-fucosyltransferase family protein n=1 Tax=Anisodus tanguticus TaxID=243964 RepID=A0AAE1VCY0_9SOLA|nr:hypothetical protein RND71_024886 [Anisodus tanguticus]
MSNGSLQSDQNFIGKAKVSGCNSSRYEVERLVFALPIQDVKESQLVSIQLLRIDEEVMCSSRGNNLLPKCEIESTKRNVLACRHFFLSILPSLHFKTLFTKERLTLFNAKSLILVEPRQLGSLVLSNEIERQPLLKLCLPLDISKERERDREGEMAAVRALSGTDASLYVEMHHVDRNRQRPSCTHPRGQHSWKSSLLSPYPLSHCLSRNHLIPLLKLGLNQQRTGITDAVVVARILNATLVVLVPELDHHSFWKDDRVPEKVMRLMRKPPYTMHVPGKSEPEYYLDQVLPVLLRRRILQLTNLIIGLQMTLMKNVAVFEPDMIAFSGCYYGGGDKERYELGEIRKRWATLPELSLDEERTRGRCPLTPHEVGLILRALGLKNDTYLYVASGEVYGGEKTLQPLKELFPNFYTKEIVAGDKLKPFLPYSSRLVAIDYIVCDESDVFVTNNNGNMAKILAGSSFLDHAKGGTWSSRGPSDQMLKDSVLCSWLEIRWTGTHSLERLNRAKADSWENLRK